MVCDDVVIARKVTNPLGNMVDGMWHTICHKECQRGAFLERIKEIS